MTPYAWVPTVFTAALLTAACGVAAPADPSVRRVNQAASHTTPSNQRLAQLDAPALLAKLNLPPETVRSASEPKGDGGWLKPLRELIGDRANDVVHAWWTVARTPRAVLAYLSAHPPTGSRLVASGSGGNTRIHIVSEDREYSWPAIPGVLGDRELAVTVVALTGGRTGVLAEAQSDWVVTRPANETIPAGVHDIDVTIAKPHGPTTLALHVTASRTVRALVSLIDALPIVQPVTISCPVLFGLDTPVITLQFRIVLGGQALARADVEDTPFLTGPCNPVSFSVYGRPQPALAGGYFVQRVQGLLGVRLLGS